MANQPQFHVTAYDDPSVVALRSFDVRKRSGLDRFTEFLIKGVGRLVVPLTLIAGIVALATGFALLVVPRVSDPAQSKIDFIRTAWLISLAVILLALVGLQLVARLKRKREALLWEIQDVRRSSGIALGEWLTENYGLTLADVQIPTGGYNREPQYDLLIAALLERGPFRNRELTFVGPGEAVLKGKLVEVGSDSNTYELRKSTLSDTSESSYFDVVVEQKL